jgi:hypothetical protein
MGLAPRNWESCMTIREIVRQGLYYARTCRSLWLFGFFVGIASGGGSHGGGNPGGHGHVGEGALIEGIVRARQGGTMTMREGFRAGWAHWGVLVRIGLLYLAATIGSVALFVAPCVIALQTLGPLGAVLLGIPLLLIAVPWLVTLYLVQAFAWRIAVLENRHAIDAIRKARLFLHGRLMLGLKLIVATFIGTLGFALVAIVGMTPVVLLLVALIPVLRVFPVIVLACLVLLPAIYVLAAMVGTFRSSIWTIGYVTQVES